MFNFHPEFVSLICKIQLKPQQGLVLCKEGNISDSLAYNISLLAKHSASLEDAPVTCVEFNTLKIVMKQTDKVVFAIISECV